MTVKQWPKEQQFVTKPAADAAKKVAQRAESSYVWDVRKQRGVYILYAVKRVGVGDAR